MSETTLSAGWGVPICSKKWHYFAAGSTVARPPVPVSRR
jgi:hypothetical protein